MQVEPRCRTKFNRSRNSVTVRPFVSRDFAGCTTSLTFAHDPLTAIRRTASSSRSTNRTASPDRALNFLSSSPSTRPKPTCSSLTFSSTHPAARAASKHMWKCRAWQAVQKRESANGLERGKKRRRHGCCSCALLCNTRYTACCRTQSYSDYSSPTTEVA